MAIDYPLHALFAFGGTLEEVSGQDEIWECTLRGFLGSSGGPASMTTWQSLDLDACLEAQASALSTWFHAQGGGLANIADLTYCKLNVISPDGRYADKSTTHLHEYPSPIAGGDLPRVPSYMSICFSWTTSHRRGLASKGRVYPPNFVYVPVGSAITSTDASAALTTGKGLLTASKQTAGLNGGVFSPAVVSNQDAAWQYITGVRIGNIYDAQRRRRNAVNETYVGSSWS